MIETGLPDPLPVNAVVPKSTSDLMIAAKRTSNLNELMAR